MATNFVAKLPTHSALIALLFRNGTQWRYLNERINSVNDASILCENFVKLPFNSDIYVTDFNSKFITIKAGLWQRRPCSSIHLYRQLQSGMNVAIDVKNVFTFFYSCHVFYVFNVFLFSLRFLK